MAFIKLKADDITFTVSLYNITNFKTSKIYRAIQGEHFDKMNYKDKVLTIDIDPSSLKCIVDIIRGYELDDIYDNDKLRIDAKYLEIGIDVLSDSSDNAEDDIDEDKYITVKKNVRIAEKPEHINVTSEVVSNYIDIK